MLLGRAYRRPGEASDFDEAHADFEAVAKKTRSLEGYLGAIDTEARQGASAESLDAKYAQVTPDELSRFVKAYLIARKLPHLSGAAHGQAVEAGIALLRGGWNELKAKREAQALFGALLHERFLSDGDRAAAQRANVHYLIALDLVRSNQREKAMVLGQLALLHSEVGNHRIALGYLDDREKLPYADNGAGLAVRLAKARTLLHVGARSRRGENRRRGHHADRSQAAAGGVSRCWRWTAPRSITWRRASSRARFQLYDLELPLRRRRQVGTQPRGGAALGRAAAALGAKQPARALDDLALVDERLAQKTLPAGLRWPHATDEEILRSYRLIAAGLRANAPQRLGGARPGIARAFGAARAVRRTAEGSARPARKFAAR